MPKENYREFEDSTKKVIDISRRYVHAKYISEAEHFVEHREAGLGIDILISALIKLEKIPCDVGDVLLKHLQKFPPDGTYVQEEPAAELVKRIQRECPYAA